tara:strand:+ start:316 stop:429 length:114 start_codon:yes stop_codon:yes gene_type:complete
MNELIENLHEALQLAETRGQRKILLRAIELAKQYRDQ